MITKKSSETVDCVVRVHRAGSDLVAVHIISGSPKINEELTCSETGSRYRIASFGLSPSLEAQAKGYELMSLEAVDGTMADHPLSTGMHLLGRKNNDG